MKYSLGISNFLGEVSSLSHFIVFLYFFVLITEEGFLSLLAIHWNSAFKWVFLSFSPLPFTCLFSAVCKASSDNHFACLCDGVVTHLEPDTLECEAKQALGSITMNKTNVRDGIPAELFQILKDDAVNMLHAICQQIWKTQQWPLDWKRSVFIPIPKKGSAKSVQIPYNCTHLTR